ncbi:DUF4150 domain-containing protein [Massilia atriviolacea]|uniref:DUF4150 domain-containing protein n=1 Tax=Massilia atriviolacea TaxID=2495579 RepID=A0A430HND1_9BURK|nr:DUF4150 domain-containing protein [Massilia atriviolacea]RSZ59025.1 DUF4150 domain-containing protein [Massilia atriviolacea]
MANPIAARKNSKFRAISTAPSLNKTPVGASLPPLPYPTFQDLSNSVGVVPTVYFNGDPAYVLDKSTQPSGKGDSPGVGKGVKSNTVAGEVKPTRASNTVSAGKRSVVRDGDPCTMNGGNNPGIYCTTSAPSEVPPKSAKGASAPPSKPETVAEKSLWDKAADAVKEASHEYKENVSGPLHKTAAELGDAGDKLLVTGAVTAGTGGLAVLTGVGAVPGAAAVTVGGGMARVGGSLNSASGALEMFATALDIGAEFATGGPLPDIEIIAEGYVRRTAGRKIDRLLKFLPGKTTTGPVRRMPDVSPPRIDARPAGPVAKVDTGKNKVNLEKAPRDTLPASPSPTALAPAPPRGGVRVRRRRRGDENCRLRKFSEHCPPGQTPHHVVPDHCFKHPTKEGQLYPGGISHADGLCLCVTGSGKYNDAAGNYITKGSMSDAEHYNILAEHGRMHILTDSAEKLLGLAGNPKYTTTLGQLEDAGATAAAIVKGCDPDDIKDQLRTYHKQNGLKADTKWRAEPSGRVAAAKNLDATKMGTSTPRGGAGVE